ncbi:MAG: hypothetical protein KGN16_00190 [Burkholderiales bacterium]|nr:hypothetical protein [Burkholderiales bacterium]
MRDFAAATWAWLRDLALVLKPCRFSAFVVVFGGALLLAVPQGREMTVRMASEGYTKSLWFCIAVAFWAFESWYWARFILDATFGPQRLITNMGRRRPERIRTLVNHVPRVTALLAYGVAVAACLSSPPRNLSTAGVLVVLGIAFYVGLVKRKHLTVVVGKHVGSKAGHWLVREPGARMGVSGLAPLSKVVLWVSIIGAAFWFVWACVDPVGLGWALGASAVPFIGFASIVPIGSIAVYMARSGGVARVESEVDRINDPHVGYPVVTLFLATALVFSLWVDNHHVRALDSSSVAHAPMSPASAVEVWYRGTARDGSPVDMVIVATAGGGIRAAYWTATVLGALQDCAPSFRSRLLAISGVSGGSLGAVTFATLLSQDAVSRPPIDCTAAGLSRAEWAPGPFESAGQKVLSNDFLAPTVAALLFPDLMQRFLPYSFLPDRAAALEKGWERAWEAAGYDAGTWRDRSFDDIWRITKGPMPSLLLNGTQVETGQRIITSNLQIDPNVFRDSIDFFDHFDGKSIRPSTAAHNSARFTYVSPAGRVNSNTRIVDGGYYDNFGAKTAAELLNLARAQLAKDGVAVQPIVILISNDPGMPANEKLVDSIASTCPKCKTSTAVNTAIANEVLSPLLALLNTRAAHGTRSVYDLYDLAPRFYHFRLCSDPLAPDPALGWVLSPVSEQSMQRLLRERNACGNREQFDDLVSRLSH